MFHSPAFHGKLTVNVRPQTWFTTRYILYLKTVPVDFLKLSAFWCRYTTTMTLFRTARERRVRTVKAQVSIRCTHVKRFVSWTTRRAPSEDCYQTARICGLIWIFILRIWRKLKLTWVFAGRTGYFVDFVMLWLIFQRQCVITVMPPWLTSVTVLQPKSVLRTRYM